MDLARAPRRAPLTARKKGSGYENAIYPGMVWSRDPRILRKMASCLLGLGGEYILSQLNMINLIALII